MGRCPIGGSAGGFPRGRQKRGLSAQFQVEIAQEIEAFLGKHSMQGIDFEALETAARGQALRLAARALESLAECGHLRLRGSTTTLFLWSVGAVPGASRKEF